MCGAYIFLLPFGFHPPLADGTPGESWLLPWMVTVVVGRELLITGLRSFMENQGSKFGADWLGKLKMGLQCAALFAIFVTQYWPGTWLDSVRDGLIYAMLGATILSGLQYMWRAILLIKPEDWRV